MINELISTIITHSINLWNFNPLVAIATGIVLTPIVTGIAYMVGIGLLVFLAYCFAPNSTNDNDPVVIVQKPKYTLHDIKQHLRVNGLENKFTDEEMKTVLDRYNKE